MGADQDVDLPLREPRENVAHLAWAPKAGDQLDLDRELGEPLAEGAEVLLGEDGRRDQHHHLLAVGDGLVRRA